MDVGQGKKAANGDPQLHDQLVYSSSITFYVKLGLSS